MSKTIRISDELYNVIDDYRKKDQTFQDVIEGMANDIGLLPAKIKDLDDLRNKLQTLYGYDSEEVSRVFDALRTVYVGQEKESTIGIPHGDIDPEYADEVDTLQRLGLAKEQHYTGKYDYGYRATAIGNKIGSELVREYINEYEDEIQRIIDGYTETEVSSFVNFGFKRTDIGHLSTRGAELATSHTDSLIEDEMIQEHYTEFLNQLLDIGLAVRHSEGHFTVIPAEFDDYLRTQGEGRPEAMQQLELYRAIKTYAMGDLESREDLLANLDTATEDDLAEVVSSLHQEGLTSRYLQRDEAPFLVKDRDQLLTRLRRDVEDAVTSE